MAQLKDGYERKTEYLRISVTDRCNLRCEYCMPREGVAFRKHEDILSYEEILRIVEILSSMGIKKVRLTGGEPTVRKGFTDFVRALKTVPGIEQIGLTTNGIAYLDMAEELRSAGLDMVNISLDSPDEAVYESITGSKGAARVLEAVDKSLSLGMRTKKNCVPLKGVNDGSLVRLASVSREKPVDVRFIELMPIGCGKKYEGLSSAEVRDMLAGEFGEYEELTEAEDLSGPARYLRFAGFRGRCGFISPMSGCFCEHCNRLRLTSEGFLKPCLHSHEGMDLRTLIRGGADDGQIRKKVEEAVAAKGKRHHFGEHSSHEELRRMNEIGG